MSNTYWAVKHVHTNMIYSWTIYPTERETRSEFVKQHRFMGMGRTWRQVSKNCGVVTVRVEIREIADRDVNEDMKFIERYGE